MHVCGTGRRPRIQQVRSPKQTNGKQPKRYIQKTVSGSQGEVELEVPRNRNGESEPQIVKKHQMDFSAIVDRIIFLYLQDTSTRDIEKAMQEMYGIEVDATRVSKITDKILSFICEWQNRPLESIYALVMLDAIHYKVQEDGTVVLKAVYIAIGTDLAGKKDVFPVGRCDGKLKILAWCAERPEKPLCFGHFAGFSRQAEWIFGSYRRGLPADGNPAQHHLSDPQFPPSGTSRTRTSNRLRLR